MNDKDFQLDPRLAADSIFICKLDLCLVALHKDTRFPWLILVPQRANVRDIIDLTEDDRQVLMDEIAQASEALRKIYTPHKLNVASLGNQVAQLHVHVIARFETDAAWPNPVWNVGKMCEYGARELDNAVAAFRRVLSKSG